MLPLVDHNFQHELDRQEPVLASKAVSVANSEGWSVDFEIIEYIQHLNYVCFHALATKHLHFAILYPSVGLSVCRKNVKSCQKRVITKAAGAVHF